MPTLELANTQWSTRPDDERFESLEHLYRHCKNQRRNARVTDDVKLRDLTVVSDGSDVRIAGKKNGATLELTAWSFNQLAQRIGLGANFLRTAREWGKVDEMAAIMNEGLQRIEHVNNENPLASIMSQIDYEANTATIRSINGPGYGRFWNEDLISHIIMPLQQEGWRTPPARPVRDGQPGTRPATADDVLVYEDSEAGMGLSVAVGDLIAPAGLYAGDRDMWVIQVNTSKRIETGVGQGLYRALVFINSEVGAKQYRAIGIGFDSICGNHYLWGAKVLGEVAIIHRGNKVTARATAETLRNANTFLHMPASVEENVIHSARLRTLAKDEESTLDLLWGKRIAPKKVLRAAWDKAVEFEHEHKAAPNTAWGFAGGLTRVSQSDRYADQRAETDAAASKVMLLSL